MKLRVDPETKLCIAHDVLACTACMVDDFYDWLAEQRERRARAKKEAKETPVDERFDLGGEA